MKPIDCRRRIFFLVAALLPSAVAGRSAAADPSDISQLLPESRKLITETMQSGKDPIELHAFVSPEAPPEYVEAIRNFRKLLAQVGNAAGERLRLQVHETATQTEVARAHIHGVHPYVVPSTVSLVSQGVPLFCHVVCTSGQKSASTGFLGPTAPAEYELLRVLRAVQDVPQKKRLGILRTEGLKGLESASDQDTSQQRFLATLRAFYDVSTIDPSKPVVADVDVLLALQPSSLEAGPFGHFVGAVKKGARTAIFEDPRPIVWSVTATDGGQMTKLFGPPDKTYVSRLWEMLGVELTRSKGNMLQKDQRQPHLVVWQRSGEGLPNQFSTPEFLVVGRVMQGRDAPFKEGLADDPAVRDISSLFFAHCGAIVPRAHAETEFRPLVKTCDNSGLTSQFPRSPFGTIANEISPADRAAADGPHVLAARIRGKRAVTKEPDSRPIDVILVADLDCITPALLADTSEHFGRVAVDNSALLLNILDALSAETHWSALRGRHMEYPPLSATEAAVRRQQAEVSVDHERKSQQASDESSAELRRRATALQEKTGEIETHQQEFMILMADSEERLRDKLRNLSSDRDKTLAELNKRARGAGPKVFSTKIEPAR